MMKKKIRLILAICVLSPLFQGLTAQAGFFNIPEFVDYQNWAVGLEPELTLSSPANTSNTGVALNVKFTYGITPLSNLQVGIGEGSGSKGFRLGGTYTFDFIPDLKGQIGAGLALQAYYYKLKGSYGQTETTLYPYLHHMIVAENGLAYDPYVAVPFGFAFFNNTYRSIFQLVVGTYVKASEHYGLNAEVGFNLKDTDTYLAVGMTYRD